MELPADIAAQAAMARQNVALSVIKQNAKAEQAIASILEQAAQNVPVSQSRGTNLNLQA
ncbi:MAG TPA: hypothetical protein VIG74_03295 [Alphaproteobacteria bacterium]